MLVCGLLSINLSKMNLNRVRGITHTVSARRWKSDGFDAQPKTASYLKTLKVETTAAMSDARH